jgi:undecaprenyl-diphosphatase
MDWLHVVVLGVIEGLTEFLPISSTAHLTIAERLFGIPLLDPGITAFTAVIQLGSMLAAVAYFRFDIARIVIAWSRGLLRPDLRDYPEYRMGWNVVIGSVPIAILGLGLHGVIEGPFRNLWVVVIGLLGWSLVMWLADRLGKATRGESSTTWLDAAVIGLVQCVALIPGVSRSGATISAGLLRGMDRVSATRISFLLGIPALVAAGGWEAVTQAGNISATVGWLPALVGIVVAFIVGYLSIAWLLSFVSRNTFTAFIVYRVSLGLLLAGLIVAGVVPPS